MLHQWRSVRGGWITPDFENGFLFPKIKQSLKGERFVTFKTFNEIWQIDWRILLYEGTSSRLPPRVWTPVWSTKVLYRVLRRLFRICEIKRCKWTFRFCLYNCGFITYLIQYAAIYFLSLHKEYLTKEIVIALYI